MLRCYVGGLVSHLYRTLAIQGGRNLSGTKIDQSIRLVTGTYSLRLHRPIISVIQRLHLSTNKPVLPAHVLTVQQQLTMALPLLRWNQFQDKYNKLLEAAGDLLPVYTNWQQQLVLEPACLSLA